ncbi:hypothetical protein TL16_g01453 [Triparma laevis f. inornata]|uniref:Arp2/3 complex 34 kDa subunit n=1 Tax=Triparma laevis f. inornata TaxID=1714386 RepID=A0A9W6ZNF9_9STRA|nr:hypothetical protein TL16_g01453 [Triparma laevis f. inornata]
MAWAAKQQGGAASGKGLMHLESENKILMEVRRGDGERWSPEPEPLPWLNEYLTFPLSFSFQFPQALTSRLGPSQKREPCELKIADFDDVLYKLFVPPETPNLVTLHCAIKDWKGVKANGGGERLEETFPGCVVEAEEGFDVSVRVDADNVPKGPWGSTGAFRVLESGGSPSPGITTITIRKPTPDGGGEMHIVSKSDRVTVVFAVDFADETDKAITRIFLQEFVEAQRSVNNCPPANFSRGSEPPMEIQSLPNADGNPDIAGFISFTIFKSHVDSKPKMIQSAKQLVNFLTYLQYHVKATKTYMHMRMRSKVNSLLQVLTRAQQMSSEVKEKKTFTGKTFTRK